MIGNPLGAVYSDELHPSNAGAEDVSPPREAKSTDVNRITFTMPTVVAIVAATVMIVGSQYLSYSSLSGKMSAMQSQIENQKENFDLKLQLMKSDIEKSELRKALLDELKATP